MRRLRDTHRIELTYDDVLVDAVAGRCTEVESGARKLCVFVARSDTAPATTLNQPVRAVNVQTLLTVPFARAAEAIELRNA